MSEPNWYAKEWAERWIKGDADGFLDLFTDDCRYEDISTGYLCNGKEELRKFYEVVHTASPGLLLQLTESFGSGEDVAMQWVMSGTVTGEFPGYGKGTGKAYSTKGASIVKLKDGKICSIRDYCNISSPSTQGESHHQ